MRWMTNGSAASWVTAPGWTSTRAWPRPCGGIATMRSGGARTSATDPASPGPRPGGRGWGATVDGSGAVALGAVGSDGDGSGAVALGAVGRLGRVGRGLALQVDRGGRHGGLLLGGSGRRHVARHADLLLRLVLAALEQRDQRRARDAAEGAALAVAVQDRHLELGGAQRTRGAVLPADAGQALDRQRQRGLQVRRNVVTGLEHRGDG